LRLKFDTYFSSPRYVPSVPTCHAVVTTDRFKKGNVSYTVPLPRNSAMQRDWPNRSLCSIDVVRSTASSTAIKNTLYQCFRASYMKMTRGTNLMQQFNLLS